MGLWDWLFGRTPPSPLADETPESVADRLDRYADRCGNAGDRTGEQDARIVAADARRAASAARALEIERDLYRAHGLRPDGRPDRPAVGERAGTEYLRLGRRVRAGGTRAWRNNNPGYVRCSDRITSYGAVGCDGEYAVFRTEDDGIAGLALALRAEHPDQPVEQAVREQLPAERADAVLDRLRESGLNLADAVRDTGEAALRTVGEACRDVGGWAAGSVFERGDAGDAPAWLADVWDQPSAGGDAVDPANTDDS